MIHHQLFLFRQEKIEPSLWSGFCQFYVLGFILRAAIWYDFDMNKKPRILVILALLHFLAPVGNMALNALVARQGILNYFLNWGDWSYLSLNWPLMVSPLVAGWAIYTCKKWSFYVYLGSISLLFYYSYQGYLSKSGIVGIGPLLFIYATNILVVGYFLIPAVREVYFDPRLRWWESQPRYNCDFACEFFEEDKKYQGIVTNISNSGLFLKSEETPKDQSMIRVEFSFEQPEKQVFVGKVVYHDKQNRFGLGIQFQHDRASLARIRKLTKLLDRLGQKMESRMGVEETFFMWLHGIFTSGKGLLPEKHEKYK